MSSQKREQPENAFSLLMNSSSKKNKKNSAATPTRLVECPCCSSNIPQIQINSHLDQCIQKNELKQKETECVPVSQDASSASASPQSTPAARDLTPTSPIIPRVEESIRKEPKANDGNDKLKSNVFALMMKQSQAVFANSGEPRNQRFHLHQDGRLSWTALDTDEPPKGIIWSSTVKLQKTKVSLTISTSIAPDETSSSKRLVRKHSRLSVPVLKSILQKSIRRRRPLPAVRVAMELMDKAKGELLRRLPIIVLEDSTLHPSLPLLVWLMAAESKDYNLPQSLIQRVLQTIYEVAQCPWTDYLPRIQDEKESAAASTNASTTMPPECNVLLKAINMRAQYGGMAGDVKMLTGYEHVWKSRFEQGSVPAKIQQHIGANEPLDWWKLPSRIHERAKSQSPQTVNPLVAQGIESLQLKDVCIEGVDFHCSTVLDPVLADQALFQQCVERFSRLDWVPSQHKQQREWILDKIKSCMWSFSSGVNHRRPLLGGGDKQQENEHLKAFWTELIEGRAKAFMKTYVQERLVC